MKGLAMKDIASTQKKPFWPVVIILVLVLGLVGIIIRLITPPSNVEVTDALFSNFDNSKTTFDQIQISMDATNVPTELPIYTIRIQNTADSVLKRLINEFDLKQSETLDYAWTSEKATLTYYELEGRITFSNLDIPSDYIPPQIKTDSAVKTSTEFLIGIFGELSLRPVERGILYFTDSPDFYDATTADNAQIARVPFQYAFSEYPVYLGKDSIEPFVVTATSDYVSKVDISLLNVVPTSNYTLETLTIDEIQTNINTNLGSVVSAINNEVLETDLSSISNGTLTFQGIEYRYDPDSQQLIPFYRFAGEVTDALGNLLQAIIITPAVPVR